jgi:capsid assembly protease
MRYSLADVAELMFNRPVAVTRDRAELILGAMGPRLNVGSLIIAGEDRQVPISELSARAADFRVDIESRPHDHEIERRDWDTGALLSPYQVWNGVAVFKVRGTLMPEGGLNPTSGATSYSGLDYKARYARADDRVRGVALDIDSGGGTIVDLFETCDQLLALREEKPVRAILRGAGCSAAYALAACANEVTAASYSWAGSIGVLIAHADFSEQLKQEGVAVTLIASGAHKTDGSELLPLGAEIREKLKAHVDRTAARFFEHVAAARPSLSVDAVASQQARIYSGEEALAANLVDQIMGWDESLREFAETVNRRQPSAAIPAQRGTAAGANRGAARMDRDNLAPAADNQPGFTQAQLDAAAETARGEAVTAERARIGQLAELDAQSTISPALTAAIAEGASVADFALQQARSTREQQASALAGARADAVQADQAPAKRTDTAASSTAPANRGAAAVERMRGRHPGLRAKA